MNPTTTPTHEKKHLTTYIEDEFKGAGYGSQRLSQRLVSISRQIVECPDKSFPDIFTSEKDLEGYYRFIRNKSVTFEETIQPHYNATYIRAHAASEVLAIHDTTSFAFSGEKGREGVGYLRNKQRGFFAHLTLITTADGEKDPLGIGAVTTWNRPKPKRHGKGQKGRQAKAKEIPWEKRETRRWANQVAAVEASKEEGTTIVHVMDREGDAYETIVALLKGPHRYIIRCHHDRNCMAIIDGKLTKKKLKRILREAPLMEIEREVTLSRRRESLLPGAKKGYPAREKRRAKLRFSAHAIQWNRPECVDPRFPKNINVNGVRVFEVETPEGCEPVEWFLVTSEPIGCAEDVMFIVDRYRGRWMIEEYIKAIKSGCAYEKRQLESFQTLLIACAIMIPVAWLLLKMRHLSRTTPNAPATSVFTPIQVEVLHHISPLKMSKTPTIREAMMAMAKCGGHIKANGDPGFLVLLRGFKDLIFAEQIWIMARGDDFASHVKAGTS